MLRRIGTVDYATPGSGYSPGDSYGGVVGRLSPSDVDTRPSDGEGRQHEPSTGSPAYTPPTYSPPSAPPGPSDAGGGWIITEGVGLVPPVQNPPTGGTSGGGTTGGTSGGGETGGGSSGGGGGGGGEIGEVAGAIGALADRLLGGSKGDTTPAPGVLYQPPASVTQSGVSGGVVLLLLLGVGAAVGVTVYLVNRGRK